MDTVQAMDYLELATPSDPRVAPDGDRVAFLRRTPRRSVDDDSEGDENAKTAADDNSDGDENAKTAADDNSDGDENAKTAADGEPVGDAQDPGSVEEEATVYVAPLGGGEPRRFTARAGEDACPRWSPSGDRLAFTSDRDDAPARQLWVMPTDGGEARRVTCVPDDVSALAWGPGGDRIAFLQDVTADERAADSDLGVGESYEREPPDPRVIDRTVYRAAESYFDGTRSHVYVVDLGARSTDTDAGTGVETGTGADAEAEGTGGDGDRETAADTASVEEPVRRVTSGDVDHTAPAWGDDGALYFGAREPSDPTADPDDAVEFAIKRFTFHAAPAPEADDRTGPGTATGTVETLTYDTGFEPMLDVASDGRVAYASTPTERGTLRQTDVHVYDPSTEATHAVTATLDRTLAHDRALQFGPNGASVYVTTPEEGSIVVRRVPVPMAGSKPVTDENAATADDAASSAQSGAAPTASIVVGEGMHCTDFHVTPDLVGFVASEWDHPGDVFAATPRGAEGTRLSHLNREYLADRAVVQPETIWFDAGDPTTLRSDGDRDDADRHDADDDRHGGDDDRHGGDDDRRDGDTGRHDTDGKRYDDDRHDADGKRYVGDVQGWLFTPPDLGPDEAAPLVVEVHGGPHVSWTPAGTMWHEFQTLAAAGFAVFACNPRGSTGYGESFQAAIERDWGPQTAADVLAGVDAVQDRDAVDGSETFVTGGSFGGYLTAWLLAHTDAFDAGVTQRGVYDLVSFYGSTDEAYKLVEWDWGETPWTDGAFLAEQSPAMHADEITAPTLVLHAENDYRVPIAGAELLYRGLRKHGTPTRFVRYPDEGHELSRSGDPGHVVDRIQRIRNWFQGYSNRFDIDEPLSRK